MCVMGCGDGEEGEVLNGSDFKRQEKKISPVTKATSVKSKLIEKLKHLIVLLQKL